MSSRGNRPTSLRRPCFPWCPKALGLNLVLNAGRSWLFFNRRRMAGAVALNVLLTTSSVDLARRAVGVRGAHAAWLALYAVWCAFATVLSAHIWLLNRRPPVPCHDG